MCNNTAVEADTHMFINTNTATCYPSTWKRLYSCWYALAYVDDGDGKEDGDGPTTTCKAGSYSKMNGC